VPADDVTDVEVLTELVPVASTYEIESYRPNMVMTIEEAVGQANALRTAVRDVLKEDVDYGVIPGTAKPSLLKPGAEWLLKLFGFGHHFDIISTDRNDAGEMTGITYRCTVTRPLPTGIVVTVATCDGYASRDEKKWSKAPWNTIIKMAQKRAMVGAALQATGTSGSFTQDMEDTLTNESVLLDVTPYIEQLPDEARDQLRELWKENRWPSPAMLPPVLALEIVFFIGQLLQCAGQDLDVLRSEVVRRMRLMISAQRG